MRDTKQNTAQESAVEDAMRLVSALELPYLVELSKRLEEHIQQRRKDDIVEARRRIEAIAKQVGLSVDALLEAPLSGNHGTRPPLYAHPHNPALTWSGHGRKPYWMRELEEQGYTLDALRIKGARAEA